jgi:hypothetical protein
VFQQSLVSNASFVDVPAGDRPITGASRPGTSATKIDSGEVSMFHDDDDWNDNPTEAVSIGQSQGKLLVYYYIY